MEFSGNSYFKNNEYFGKFRKGFTGIGVILEPKIKYISKLKISYSAGIYLQKYSGQDTLTRHIPILTISMPVGNNTQFISGRIDDRDKHGLPEQIMEIDAQYLHDPEYGFQLLYEGKSLKSDLWLNWSKYLFEGDNAQESFTAGYSWNMTVNLLKFNKLSFPGALTVFHRGGQINTGEHKVLNMVNLYSGISFSLIHKDRLRIQPHLRYFYYMGPVNYYEQVDDWPYFSEGRAVDLSLEIVLAAVSSHFGIWHADQYLAPHGEALFQSSSAHDPNFRDASRMLYYTRISHDGHAAGQGGSRYQFDPFLNLYFDPEYQDLEYSFGFFLRFNEILF